MPPTCCEIGQATDSIAPDLVVLAGTVPEPFAAHADAIADLARQTTVALGGAGASAADPKATS